MTTSAFCILAPLILIAATAVILWESPIVSALSLVAMLILLAIAYFLLDAPFVGIFQVLVYAGAIMVLFIFVIMLINLQEEELEHLTWSSGKIMKITGIGILTVGAALALVPVLRHQEPPGTRQTPAPEFGTLAALGKNLFGEYLLSFEFISVVILAAAVGAILLAKRHSHGGRS